MKELEILREKVKELECLKREKVNLEAKVNDLEETIQEKDEEIGEKERQVNHQKDMVKRETELKEEFQKELEEIKNKKRDWKSFYDWLLNNAIELENGILGEKVPLKLKYKQFIQNLNLIQPVYKTEQTSEQRVCAWVLDKLEYKLVGKVEKSHFKDGGIFHDPEHKLPVLLDYVEADKFVNLVRQDEYNWKIILRGIGEEPQKYFDFYEMLFSEWKKGTSLQNTTSE